MQLDLQPCSDASTCPGSETRRHGRERERERAQPNAGRPDLPSMERRERMTHTASKKKDMRCQVCDRPKHLPWQMTTGPPPPHWSRLFGLERSETTRGSAGRCRAVTLQVKKLLWSFSPSSGPVVSESLQTAFIQIKVTMLHSTTPTARRKHGTHLHRAVGVSEL